MDRPSCAHTTPESAMYGEFRRMQPLAGLHYQDFLQQLHQRLGPVRYLEIGTQQGKSLRHANGRAVAIDPSFRLDVAQWRMRPGCALYEMTSEAYFAGHDPRDHLKGPIDVAFIDGMHLSDFVLRDFIAVERFCSRQGIVILHDVLPINHEMTERDRQPSKRRDRDLATSWTGDVWRVLPELMRLRPDLRIEVLDCPPTGLAVVRNLDSTSGLLGHEAADLVRRFTESEPDEDAFWSFVLGLRLTNARTWLASNAQALDGLQRASIAGRRAHAA